MSIKLNFKVAIGFALMALVSQSTMATTCTGTCGTLGADGVVTAPAGSYSYITTDGSSSYGVSPFNTGVETNGSTLVSSSFQANAGQVLSYNFNYVTSDGSGYPDYAWARLLNASDNSQAALLLTARTLPSGNIIPGQGLPTPNATLNPANVAIISGAPVWAPLGSSSGTCWAAGCGYTGWVNSSFTVASTGTYKLEFGVVNAWDTLYQSGLAFNGAMIGTTPIEDNPLPVPEPETYAMMLAGLGLMGFTVRRKKSA